MEYRKLYDEKGNLTGEIIKREEKCPINRRVLVSSIIIENSKNKYLIQKRSNIKKNKWAFTSGHMENDENSIIGILREVKEELGIDLDPKKIFKINSGINEKYVFDSYYIKKDIDINSLKLQKEEVEYVKWSSLEEIKSLIDSNLFLESHICIYDNLLKYLENCK